MKKREFLKVTGIVAAGSMIATNCFLWEPSKHQTTGVPKIQQLVSLSYRGYSYGFEALEPHIDRMTMEIHHDKHHAGYVRKLNAALEGSELAGKNLS